MTSLRSNEKTADHRTLVLRFRPTEADGKTHALTRGKGKSVIWPENIVRIFHSFQLKGQPDRFQQLGIQIMQHRCR